MSQQAAIREEELKNRVAAAFFGKYDCTRIVGNIDFRRSLVTGIANTGGGATTESLAYSYDALNRPTMRNNDMFGYNERGEVVFSRRGAENAEEIYEYDCIGNLLEASQCASMTNVYVANNLNQYSSIREISASSASLRETSYDADGNMLSDGILSFTYDAANRLKTVSSNGVLIVTNFYDAKSRRVKKVTQEATMTFFYDGWNLVEERIAYTNGTSSTIHYYWGKDLSGTLQDAGGVGGLLYLTVDGMPYVPNYDNIGNITHYLDANGNTIAQYTYDAFGKITAQSGQLAHLFRHRFSTKYFDAETGLYYYGYRFYHPPLLRWLNRDPIEEEGGLNLYGFCVNNAILHYDNLGQIANPSSKHHNWAVVQLPWNSEFHTYNCVEFDLRGTKDKYVTHFQDKTFRNLDSTYRSYFSYALVDRLGMNSDTKACWCLDLTPMELKCRINGKWEEFKFRAYVRLLDKHPCCDDKTEIHVANLEGTWIEIKHQKRRR